MTMQFKFYQNLLPRFGFYPERQNSPLYLRAAKYTFSLLILAPAILIFAVPGLSATFVVNSTADPGDGTCNATNCTLREAMNAAFNNAGIDTVTFNILPGGPQTITLSGGLSIQNSPENIDGTTQPGYSGTPLIELNGNGSGGDGIFISGGGSTIKGLIINRFGGNGIAMQNTGNNRVTGCYIGTDGTGMLARPNGQNGILISSSPANIIGGLTAAERNVISGNGANGIVIQNGNTTNTQILGNYIGTNAVGTAAVGNSGRGISIDSPFGTIGGSAAGARNIISGNTGAGMVIFNSTSTQNRVQGNYIGTDVSGTFALPNEFGIILGDQLVPRGSSNDFIGTDGDGVNDAVEGNLVSGNLESGIVLVAGGTSNNRVSGNRVGINAAGNAAIPNGVDGISLNGGPTGNIIGTNGDGISDAEERNIISGNGVNGISIFGPGTNANRISGNFIGTNTAGTAAVPNAQHGVIITTNVANNFIGTNADGVGDTAEANLISGNTGSGVAISGNATGNRILGNSISANGGVGIDLGINGVTMNDTGDGDTGPNNLQNFPLINSAITGSTTVNFTLNSTPGTTFRMEFFSNPAPDPTGFGEGQTFLGFMNVTTNGSGTITAIFTSPITTPAGQFVSATATDPNGNTSEFSGVVSVLLPAPTAALVTVGGRVLTADGRGIYGAKVFISDSSGNTRSTQTNPFGFYRFNDVEAGQTYIIQVRHKAYSFTTQVVSISDEILDVNIFADPPGKGT